MKAMMGSSKVGLVLVLLMFIVGTKGRTYLEDLTLTADQKTALDKFKDRVIPKLTQDYMKEDVCLLRWLRDNDFKLREAERALYNHLQWRKENKIDTILDEDWSEYERELKFSLEGHDKEGKPLLFIDVGNIDVRQILIRGRREQALRYVYKSYEEMAQKVRYLGKTYHNVTRAQILINLKGYNLIQHGCLQCVPFLLRIVTTYMQQYPGYVDTLYLINTPDAIGPLLDTSRQIFSPNAKYFKVFGTNRKQWEKAISSIYDWDQLPPTLGGTMVYKGMEDE